MAYREALEKAGATVHEFQEFGSYQGDWWAKVTYNGATGWIQGCYGSCSGCDSFEAEFGYDGDKCEDHKWDSDKAAEGCEACSAAAVDYEKRLAEFGEGYLECLISQEDAIKVASENLEWDMDAQEMVDYLKSK